VTRWRGQLNRPGSIPGQSHRTTPESYFAAFFATGFFASDMRRMEAVLAAADFLGQQVFPQAAWSGLTPIASKAAESAAPILATKLTHAGNRGSKAPANSGLVVAQACNKIGTVPARDPGTPSRTRPVAPTTR